MLSVGDVVLEVTRTPKHCLGVYAEVRDGGVVTVGDEVLIQPAAVPTGRPGRPAAVAAGLGVVPGRPGPAH
jgi:hypothetical protein